MGKPKLKSSIKALLSFKAAAGPRTMTWVCVQQAKTDSFREVYKSYNSVYYTTSPSATSSSLCTTSNEEGPEPAPCSSSLSSEWCDAHTIESVRSGAVSPRRFFFSPCTTKSLMEEYSPLRGSPLKEAEETEDDDGEVGFCKESVKIAVASEDPYGDFRASMEEMVEAHGLRDWSRLQELLQCYLRLNEKKTHKIIFLAFVDLLTNLIADDEEGSAGDFVHPPLSVIESER